MFGLSKLWSKSEKQESAVAVQEKPKNVKKPSRAKKEEKALPPDPLQIAVDKIATRPAGEYILYTQAAESFPERILEIGVDDCQRIATLLQFGVLVIPKDHMLYVGLDWFDSRTESQRPGISYNDAVNLLASFDVKIKLQPGDPSGTCLSIVNALSSRKIDWVMISEEISPKKMRALWPLFPRILKPETRFFLEKKGEYRLIPVGEVQKIALKAEEIARLG